MTQEAINNGKVLLSLNCSREHVEDLQKILDCTDLLKKILTSPVVSNKKKYNIIDKIMKKTKLPKCLISFLKVMCKNGMIDQMDEILESYYRQWDLQHDILRVRAAFAEDPSEKEKKEVYSYIEGKFPGWKCVCQFEVEPELLGGFKLRYGNIEYDRSILNRLQYLENIISS